MPVINNATPVYPSITALSYEGSASDSEVMITTRVPSNLFDFEGETDIYISGSLILKFAEAQRELTLEDRQNRMLQAGEDVDSLLDPSEEETSFDLRITLSPDGTVRVLGNGGNGGIVSSGKAMASKSIAVLGMILITAYALW